MIKTYEIRQGSMTGKLLRTVEIDTDENGKVITADPYKSGGAIEAAAAVGAGRRGFNRETGTPGMSGVFSLRGRGGSNEGTIHVSVRPR